MKNHIVDYLDVDGIRRRALVPSKNVDPEQGIRLSIDIDRIYQDASIEFRRRLVEELYNVGLVEADDFKPLEAAQRVRSALMAAIQNDVNKIVAFAKKEREK